MGTRFVSISLVCAVVLGTGLAQAAEGPSYRYDKRLGKCVNPAGLAGFNSKYQGECGELWGADLARSKLEKVNLAGANLPRADLSGADLRGADLSGASLLMTNLKDAKLEGAIFSERTILPFDRAEAERRGMVFVPFNELKAAKKAATKKGSR
jgi:hypothetical protein